MKPLFLIIAMVTIGLGQESRYTRTNKKTLEMESIIIHGTGVKVKSKDVIDITVFNGVKGDTLGHLQGRWLWKEHDWVYVYSMVRFNTFCGVMHDQAGCPDEWQKGYRICKVCYRKEYFHEIRWTEKAKSQIETLNEIVDSLRIMEWRKK